MKTKQQHLVTSISLGALLVILVALIALPLAGSIRTGSRDILEQKKELKLLQAEEDNTVELKSLYKELQPSLSRLDTLFINPEAPVDFISFIERNAYESQIKIDVTHLPISGVQKEVWPVLAFRISCNGSVQNLLRFIDKLENAYDYLITLQDLTIKRLSAEDIKKSAYEGLSVGDVEASFSIKTYTK